MLVTFSGQLKALQAAFVAVIVAAGLVVAPPELKKVMPVRVVDVAAVQLQAAIAPILSAASSTAPAVGSVTTQTQSNASAVAAAETGTSGLQDFIFWSNVQNNLLLLLLAPIALPFAILYGISLALGGSCWIPGTYYLCARATATVAPPSNAPVRELAPTAAATLAQAESTPTAAPEVTAVPDAPITVAGTNRSEPLVRSQARASRGVGAARSLAGREAAAAVAAVADGAVLGGSERSAAGTRSAASRAVRDAAPRAASAARAGAAATG